MVSGACIVSAGTSLTIATLADSKPSPPIGTGGDVDIPTGHILHREQMKTFVLAEAEPWHRLHLTRLYDLWDAWNEAYFGGRMVPPYILLAEPSNPRRLGDTATVSGFGGRSQIRIRPSLLEGTYPAMRDGSHDPEGRFRVAADVLLHEMIHQWQQEVVRKTEGGYHGHGPTFRGQANVIGASLGLGAVRTSKARGPDRDRPSCAQWPHCVRPDDYYLGAYVVSVPSDGDTPDDPSPDALVDQLVTLSNGDLASVVSTVLNRRTLGCDDDPNGIAFLFGYLLLRLDADRLCVLYNLVTDCLVPDEELA